MSVGRVELAAHIFSSFPSLFLTKLYAIATEVLDAMYPFIHITGTRPYYTIVFYTLCLSSNKSEPLLFYQIVPILL